MPGDEPQANTSEVASTSSSTVTTEVQPLLPAGLAMPKPLKTEGNLASNWKKFKRAWDNYAIVARLNRFEEEFKTATFLSSIGEEAMEIFEGLDLASEDKRTKFDIVVKKFQDLCLGGTNETYERFLFNSRQKNETESVDQYITALRTLAKTCNFCACLRDSLIRDRLVIGINNNALQKKLQQDRNLTLAKAIDICRSSESTKQQVKKIHADDDQAASEAEINAMFTNANKTQTGRRDGGRGSFERRDGGRDSRIQCKYCGTSHQKKKESCPAFGSRCRNCSRDNHYAKVNQVSEDVPAPHPLGLKLEDVQETYPDVFEGLGTLGPELHLDVDPNFSPVQLPPRKIPESLKQPLHEHLDDLVKHDVIERVPEQTEWVSALVVVAKPNGKIRLCLDPRPLNKALKRCHHPIPTMDDVLPELSNAKVGTKQPTPHSAKSRN